MSDGGEMKGPCAKQTTIAIIVNGNRFWVGFNWCENPQTECPRKGMKTGEGYELCKEICKQKSHAEIDACYKAGKEAKGGTLYLIGHYYACDDCIKTMKTFGIKQYVVVSDANARPV